MVEDINVSLRNLGTVNKNEVIISTPKGSVNLYFSYETLVGVDNTISENIWSKTTGKFLNELQPDKSKRVPYEEVVKLAKEKLKSIL